MFDVDNPWSDYVDKIEEMLDDSQYDFASDTLSGILEWVQENEKITEKQMQAVDNIENSR